MEKMMPQKDAEHGHTRYQRNGNRLPVDTLKHQLKLQEKLLKCCIIFVFLAEIFVEIIYASYYIIILHIMLLFMYTINIWMRGPSLKLS